jgi:hypothetical protein
MKVLSVVLPLFNGDTKVSPCRTSSFNGAVNVPPDGLPSLKNRLKSLGYGLLIAQIYHISNE